MALDVGTLAFFLTMEDRGFTKGMDQAEAKASSLTSTAKSAASTLAGLFTGAAAATGGIVTALVKTGGAYNTLQQNSRAALKTLLGSTEAVNEQMGKLNDLASRSPFAKTAFITAQQQLLSFGVEVEKTIPMLDALQNAVAATGGSSQQLQDLAFVMAQIKAAGKITGQDLLQLGQRGINAAELIGKAFGKTGAEIKEMISKNQISADEALDAITNGMAEKFAGTTDAVKQQWSGAVDRIKAAWRDMGADIASPFIDPNGGGKAVVWGNLVADTLRSVRRHVKTLTGDFTRLGSGGFDKITTGLQKVNVWVSSINTAKLVADLHRLGQYAPMIAALGSAFTIMGTRSIPVIGGLTGAINPLVAAVTVLTAASPELRSVATAFANGFAPAVPALTEVAAAAADLGMRVIHDLSPALAKIAEELGEFLAQLTPIAGAAIQVAGGLVPLAKIALDLAGAILQLPTPVLAAAAAFVALRGPAAGLVSTITGLGKPLQTAGAAIGLFISQAAQTGVLNATKQAFSGLGGALAGLVSPAGLVTAGLTVLVGVIAAYAAKKAEANRKAQEFADTLDKETGAVTENSRAWVAKQLEDEGLIEKYQKMGGAASDLTDSLLGQASATERVRATLEAAGKQAEFADETWTDINGTSHTTAGSATELGNKLKELGQATQDGTEKSKRLSAATEDSNAAFERQQQVLDKAADALRAYSAAQGRLTDANYRAHDAVEKLNTEFADVTSLARDASGAIDWYEQSNRKFMETSRDAVQAQNDQLNAMKDAGATQEELNAKIASNRAYWESWASQMGLNEQETQAFIEKLGALQDVKSTRVDITAIADTEEAKKQVDAFIESVKTNQSGVMTIKADNAPAIDSLMEALGITKDSTGVYTIDANSDPANAALLAALGVVDSSTGTVTIDGNNFPANTSLNSVVSTIQASNPKLRIGAVDNATPTLQNIWNQWNGRTITVNGVMKMVGVASKQADGSVLEFYADGGMRREESHVAQIAPAGSMRVWAEPETGGEAYIPLAWSKRPRSREILAEVARRFGDVYVPATASHYANGSPAGPTRVQQTPEVHVVAYVTNPWTGEQVQAFARTEAVKVVRESV